MHPKKKDKNNLTLYVFLNMFKQSGQLEGTPTWSWCYRKDTEPLYHAFVYSLIIQQLLTIYQGVHITYFNASCAQETTCTWAAAATVKLNS